MAGRVAELTLMPLSIHELDSAEKLPDRVEEYVFKGSYPELYKKELSITRFYGDYIDTYIKKDVRQLLNMRDIVLFKKFIKACAARTGQLLNLSSISEDLGIAPNTVKHWLSVLVATYVIFLLEPYNKKIPKRLIKSPKLFFHDTGLACSLLGLRTSQEVADSYLRGNLIETSIISDLYKQYCNLDVDPDGLYFFRTQDGQEIDAILNKTPQPIAVEIKASKTISPEYFKELKKWQEISKSPGSSSYIIYGGDDVQQWPAAKVLGWQSSGTLVKDSLFTE